MAHAVWSGALTFGLVSLPVQLFSATESHTIRFRQLERGTSDRIRNKRVNERTGEEVEAEDIVKGLETDGGYVVVEPDELDEIAPGRSKTLEIDGFVDLDDVDPIYFDRTYWLAPKDDEHLKIYALLHGALSRTHRAGIATFVMRNREYLIAVKAEDDVLAAHTLHWADELRDPADEIKTVRSPGDLPDKELKTAVELVETLGMDWKPKEYRDTYRERVLELVEAKGRGETYEKADPPPRATNVVDLMDVLRKSVDDAGDKRRKGGRRKGGRRKGGRRKGRQSRTAREELERLNKKQLYDRAADADITGRSSMNRDELIEALEKAS
ncbi:non-homologous end joining protein Ku [Streptomyces beihaiensis]|uniref:Non-homologous end joining protein Ku n=1 Tax=Streptomyces beihaiensis TaxID=2984495 RepID=A0ABT3TR68_9ACTN|nr:Ku protein [Streptomyces beihaiensis]MCX3059534.1 Ku protein [Streptomyces beihaiensis]